MNNRITYLSEIIFALKYYNGMAWLKEINQFIESRNVLPYLQTNPIGQEMFLL